MTQLASASRVMLTPNKIETAVHGCWLLSSFFLVATGLCPFYHCRLGAYACGLNIPSLHFDADMLSIDGEVIDVF